MMRILLIQNYEYKFVRHLPIVPSIYVIVVVVR